MAFRPWGTDFLESPQTYKAHTSGLEGQWVSSIVVRAKARTYPTASFSAGCKVVR